MIRIALLIGALGISVQAVDIDAAMSRGVDFLLAHQNADGSWGTPGNTKALNIYLPVPSGHHAVRAACTALCVDALREVKGEPAEKARAKGAKWLLANLAGVKRVAPNSLYNVWTHAYALGALLRLREDGGFWERTAYNRAIKHEIAQLIRYESVGGGWGYYDFVMKAARPASSSTSFMNGSVLIALRDATDAGFSVPADLVERGLRETLRQRNGDGTFMYSHKFTWWPAKDIHRRPGSLGRSQVCHLALRRWEIGDITNAEIATWLDNLLQRNDWLGMGLKRPIPHESWFQVAGYFYYYGHYYAAYCIELLPPEQQEYYRHRLAATILSHQDGDGSWWDFPMYGYHQSYGTAFALMTLQRVHRP
ncbi:MAG: hypothetical protein ACI8W8_005092 [Rhodothermales bacterium]|jgi:hypothetical protein